MRVHFKFFESVELGKRVTSLVLKILTYKVGFRKKKIYMSCNIENYPEYLIDTNSYLKPLWRTTLIPVNKYR